MFNFVLTESIWKVTPNHGLSDVVDCLIHIFASLIPFFLKALNFYNLLIQLFWSIPKYLQTNNNARFCHSSSQRLTRLDLKPSV